MRYVLVFVALCCAFVLGFSIPSGELGLEEIAAVGIAAAALATVAP